MLKQSGNSPDIACKQSYAESNIQHRLDIYMEQVITIEQAGFTKGRGGPLHEIKSQIYDG